MPGCPVAHESRRMITIINQELLGSLDMKVLSVQRTEAGRWWNFRKVISPFSRLWLILGGRAVVTHHGRKFILNPGQLHLVPPFTVHDCFCSRRFDHYHLHFVSRLPTGIDLLSLLDYEFQLPATRDTLKQFKRIELLYPDRKLPCFDPSREEYRRFPVTAEQTGHDLPAVDWFEARGILALLLSPFLKSARSHEGVHARATARFLAVQEFIHARMREPILLGDLARVAKLHPTYFSDRFQQFVGVRPLDYLMRRRIERAQYLLLTSPASVKEVANEVGIPDPAYFSRVFGRLCKCSPKAYRLAHGFGG
jgi:AraC-like DNA-binding protein